MHVDELLDRLDSRFPLENAATWDAVGLQIGWPGADVGRIAVCHEVTNQVIATCADSSINTLVSYHPLLFVPTTKLIDGPTAGGRALRLAHLGVSLLVVHTAYDDATPGTGDALIDALGLPGITTRWAQEEGEGQCAPGRLLELSTAIAGEALVAAVSETLDTAVRTAGSVDEVRRIAVLPGSGGSHTMEAARIADVLITGDVSHHTASAAQAHGLMIIDAGHAATERPGVAALYDAVCDEVGEAAHLQDDPTPWEA